MSRDEAATRRELVDPAFEEAGWLDSQIQREYHYKAGRVFLVGDEARREQAQFVDYVLRERFGGIALAVCEAKDESHSPGAGLQQAAAYARDLGCPLAMSSNGHQFVLQDLRTGLITQMTNPPGPAMFLDWQEETVRASEPNPLRAPSLVDRPLRYYQERAVQLVVEAAIMGRTRCLLNLATGTGKTVVAANFVHKLWKSGYRKKTLFLVDRVALLGQAYNRFAAFGDARTIVGGDGDLPLHRDIHFATYQSLYGMRGSQRLFELYPSDYFDLIVVDECHRSGYGDWSLILKYFDGALQVGLTATPKRADNIDTYEYFGAESRDEAGYAGADFEYSLAKGIEDGFLATYQVLRVATNIDQSGLHIEHELEQGAELFVPEDIDPKDSYLLEHFEREICVPDRTRVLCRHLANKILEWGPEQRTIVFCVSMAHADLVRSELQNLLGVPAGKTKYAVRIVSEERDAQELLEEFQNPRAREPLLATTVDLLSTGIDIPTLRNVVFMKPVASAVAFKQIVGRGTRIDEASGKLFFRIVDYTNATRLFDSWDLPEPIARNEEELKGDQKLTAFVVDETTGEPVANAQVTLSIGRHVVRRGKTSTLGTLLLEELPSGTLSARVTKVGFGATRRVVDLPAQEQLVVALAATASSPGRITISGVDVVLASEVTLILSDDGRTLTIQQYVDLAGRRIREATSNAGVSLAEIWRDPASREEFRKQLNEHRVDPALLALVLERPDVDPVDLMTHVAWGTSLRTREERARRAEHRADSMLNIMSPGQREIVRALFDQYRVGGVEELDTASVFQTPALMELGGLHAAVGAFGGPAGLRDLLAAARAEVYRNGGAA